MSVTFYIVFVSGARCRDSVSQTPPTTAASPAGVRQRLRGLLLVAGTPKTCSRRLSDTPHSVWLHGCVTRPNTHRGPATQPLTAGPCSLGPPICSLQGELGFLGSVFRCHTSVRSYSVGLGLTYFTQHHAPSCTHVVAHGKIPSF